MRTSPRVTRLPSSVFVFPESRSRGGGPTATTNLDANFKMGEVPAVLDSGVTRIDVDALAACTSAGVEWSGVRMAS